MLSQGSILIIDDKAEDGQPISDQLKELCIPHLFFHADDEKIRAIRDNKPQYIQKVRVILQDINLTDSGSPGTADYDIAVTAIENLLPDENGPWLLATWSTYAEDNGVSHAKLLFEHLVENLPSELRPFDYVVLEKSKFTGGATHGRVTSYADMDEQTRQSLANEITTTVTSSPAMSALLEWEHSVMQSVSTSISDLHFLSNAGDNHDHSLGKLLHELAKAEAGKSLSNTNARQALTRILNNQLLNKVTSFGSDSIDIEQYADKPVPPDFQEWKRKVNALLHLAPPDPSGGPGSVYTFDSYIRSMTDLRPLLEGHSQEIEPWRSHITDDKIRKNYVEQINNINNQGFVDYMTPYINSAQTIIIDATPPCDHSQQKSEFRKFCAGLLLELPVLTGNHKKKFKSSILDPDFLWVSCNFFIEEGGATIQNALLTFNSRLTFSGPDADSFNECLQPAKIVKVSEQITKDFVHWLKTQESRPGYTYMY
ncbi:MAG: hypothetical protein JAY90_13810 [Candidatus Thiodiazotropha lotti]|nr:hypothetical protein [Candidatus Thiodiazotropha lotti]